jgi:hypothetical protein
MIVQDAHIRGEAVVAVGELTSHRGICENLDANPEPQTSEIISARAVIKPRASGMDQSISTASRQIGSKTHASYDMFILTVVTSTVMQQYIT